MQAIKEFEFTEGWDKEVEAGGIRGKIGGFFGLKKKKKIPLDWRPEPKRNPGFEGAQSNRQPEAVGITPAYPSPAVAAGGASTDHNISGSSATDNVDNAHAHFAGGFGSAGAASALPAVIQEGARKGQPVSSRFAIMSPGLQAAELVGVDDSEQDWLYEAFEKNGAGIVEERFRQYAQPRVGLPRGSTIKEVERGTQDGDRTKVRDEMGNIVTVEEFNCADGWFLVHKYTTQKLKRYKGHAYLICVIYKKVMTRHILKVPFPAAGMTPLEQQSILSGKRTGQVGLSATITFLREVQLESGWKVPLTYHVSVPSLQDRIEERILQHTREVDAATKIIAAWRGYQTRKYGGKALSTGIMFALLGPSDVGEELVMEIDGELDYDAKAAEIERAEQERDEEQQRIDDLEEQNSAATFIQTQFRGFQAKRAVQGKRDDIAAEEAKIAAKRALEEKIDEQIAQHNREVDATLKLQAAFRGWQIRKRMSGMGQSTTAAALALAGGADKAMATKLKEQYIGGERFELDLGGFLGGASPSELAAEDAKKEDLAEQESAATFIQAQFRGLKARRQADEARKQLFVAADTDGDGMLSLQEAMDQGMDEATFNEIDADSNGQLTQEEFANWQEERQLELEIVEREARAAAVKKAKREAERAKRAARRQTSSSDGSVPPEATADAPAAAAAAAAATAAAEQPTPLEDSIAEREARAAAEKKATREAERAKRAARRQTSSSDGSASPEANAAAGVPAAFADAVVAAAPTMSLAERLEKEVNDHNIQVDAVVKLQAAWRGLQTRRQLKDGTLKPSEKAPADDASRLLLEDGEVFEMVVHTDSSTAPRPQPRAKRNSLMENSWPSAPEPEPLPKLRSVKRLPPPPAPTAAKPIPALRKLVPKLTLAEKLELQVAEHNEQVEAVVKLQTAWRGTVARRAMKAGTLGSSAASAGPTAAQEALAVGGGDEFELSAAPLQMPIPRPRKIPLAERVEMEIDEHNEQVAAVVALQTAWRGARTRRAFLNGTLQPEAAGPSAATKVLADQDGGEEFELSAAPMELPAKKSRLDRAGPLADRLEQQVAEHNEQVEAVVKLQTAWRGTVARRAMKAGTLGSSAASAGPTAAQEALAVGGGDEFELDLTSLVPRTSNALAAKVEAQVDAHNEEVEAVVAIQTAWRGAKVRRALKNGSLQATSSSGLSGAQKVLLVVGEGEEFELNLPTKPAVPPRPFGLASTLRPTPSRREQPGTQPLETKTANTPPALNRRSSLSRAIPLADRIELQIEQHNQEVGAAVTLQAAWKGTLARRAVKDGTLSPVQAPVLAKKSSYVGEVFEIDPALGNIQVASPTASTTARPQKTNTEEEQRQLASFSSGTSSPSRSRTSSRSSSRRSSLRGPLWDEVYKVAPAEVKAAVQNLLDGDGGTADSDAAPSDEPLDAPDSQRQPSTQTKNTHPHTTLRTPPPPMTTASRTAATSSTDATTPAAAPTLLVIADNASMVPQPQPRQPVQPAATTTTTTMATTTMTTTTSACAAPQPTSTWSPSKSFNANAVPAAAKAPKPKPRAILPLAPPKTLSKPSPVMAKVGELYEAAQDFNAAKARQVTVVNKSIVRLVKVVGSTWWQVEVLVTRDLTQISAKGFAPARIFVASTLVAPASEQVAAARSVAARPVAARPVAARPVAARPAAALPAAAPRLHAAVSRLPAAVDGYAVRYRATSAVEARAAKQLSFTAGTEFVLVKERGKWLVVDMLGPDGTTIGSGWAPARVMEIV